jgi:hypothetical protein
MEVMIFSKFIFAKNSMRVELTLRPGLVLA